MNHLIDYIEDNITQYVQTIFLKLENNTEEEQEYYISLLNNENLESELKEDIIRKTNTIVDDINEVFDGEISKLLFKYSKIKPTWDNILISFEENGNTFAKEVVDYLNNMSNALILSKDKMSTKKTEDGKAKYSSISSAIMHESKIEIESLKLLIDAIPWWYESFETKKLSSDRIMVLIENGKVKPSSAAYEYLRENFKGTNIQLFEKNIDVFSKLLNYINIDDKDLELILASKKIKIGIKYDCINHVSEEIINANKNNAIFVIQEVLNPNKKLQISDSLIISLITNEYLPKVERIKLFHNNIALLSTDDIDCFLNSLGGNYQEITDKTKKATLVNTSENKILLDDLASLKYISSVSKIEKGLRVNHRKID